MSGSMPYSSHPYISYISLSREFSDSLNWGLSWWFQIFLCELLFPVLSLTAGEDCGMESGSLQLELLVAPPFWPCLRQHLGCRKVFYLSGFPFMVLPFLLNCCHSCFSWVPYAGWRSVAEWGVFHWYLGLLLRW